MKSSTFHELRFSLRLRGHRSDVPRHCRAGAVLSSSATQSTLEALRNLGPNDQPTKQHPFTSLLGVAHLKSA